MSKNKYNPIPESNGQIKFDIPLSFDQELISTTGTTGFTGSAIPLSLVAQNTDKIYGVLKLRFNNDRSMVAYKLFVYNAINPQNKVTLSHLHLGKAYENGPVIVPLFNGPARNVNGELIEGVIGNDGINNTSIADISVINSVSSLYAAIVGGSVYANVHTVKYPGGLIRGQIYSNLGCNQICSK